jgi:peptidoglycan/xylan/chitin deacetylase (PgdA/CDA1 family)
VYHKEQVRLHRSVVVTTSWDDGSKSDIELAKLLKKFSINATFYVTRDYRHLEDPLSPHQVIELDEAFEIGAHTLTHPNLLTVDTEAARSEIAGSKRYLEDLLEHEVRMFCYPRGKYSERVVQLVKSAGFEGARTCRSRDFGVSDDPYLLPVTLQATNKSPLSAFRIWGRNRLTLKSLMDWETRAKEMFDLRLETGGIYHLWGHSSEIQLNGEWEKLENVFKYVSSREGVSYLTNGECIQDLD